MLTVDEMKAMLHTWETLDTRIMKLTEDEVQKLMEHERKNRRRRSVVHRLYGRFSTLRAERERRTLGIAA